MKRLEAMYKKLSSELLQARYESLQQDLTNRANNMLYDRATAEKQAKIIKSILDKRNAPRELTDEQLKNQTVDSILASWRALEK